MCNDKMIKYYLENYNKFEIKEAQKKLRKPLDKDNDKYLEEIESIKYDKNSALRNYVSYFLKEEILNKKLRVFKQVEIDKLWILNSNFENITPYEINKNCKNELRADTIFSVWTILEKSIRLVLDKNIKLTKHSKKIIKNIENLEIIYNNLDEIFNENKDLYDSLNSFCKVACSRGNVIKYPYIKNNISFQSRGLKYNDLFLKSLAECFEKGEFSVLFGKESNYNSPIDFIKSQNLKCFFKNDREYKKENIINIGKLTIDSTNLEHIEKIDDIIEILNIYENIINQRNESIKN